jgi:hypothetical protein
VTVNIYDMGTSLNAFGIYTAQRSGEAQKLEIGTEAIISPPYQCLLLKDMFYVKVEAFEGKITEAAGKNILEAVAKALPGKEEFPEELGRLPGKGKIEGSEGFFGESYLGLSALNNCVYARYKEGSGEEFQLFSMIPGAGESDESLWKKLAAKWQVVKGKKHKVLAKKIPYKGLVGVTLTDEGLFGAAAFINEKELVKRMGIFWK